MWTEDAKQNEGFDVVIESLEVFDYSLNQQLLTEQEAAETAFAIEKEKLWQENR